MTDAAFSSLLRYNYIRMDSAVQTITWNVTGASCQAACSAAASCQYFVFTDLHGSGTKCSLRNLGVTPANVTNNLQSYILFQV
jgi:hypothetical protein